MLPFMAPMMLGQGAPTIAATTWDPSNSTTDIVYSNNNLTLASSGNARGTKSARSVSSGDIYYEITVGDVGSEIEVGFSRPTDGKAFFVDNVGVWYLLNSGDVFIGQSNQLNVGAAKAGDKVGLRYRFSDGRFFVYKNGALLGSVTGYGGIAPLGAAITLYGAPRITANFGATAFAGGLPSGSTIL